MREASFVGFMTKEPCGTARSGDTPTARREGSLNAHPFLVT